MVHHKYGVFALDGTGHHAASLLLPFGGVLAVPAPASYAGAPDAPAGEPWNTYIVPLDDRHAHWLRLMGECRIWSDPAHRDGKAHPSKGRHAGGIVHPEHSHVHLGGTITWDAEPHPLVQEHMDWLDQMSQEDLFIHLCGPRVFDYGAMSRG